MIKDIFWKISCKEKLANNRWCGKIFKCSIFRANRARRYFAIGIKKIKAIINQANLSTWFDDIEVLEDHEKINLYFLLSVAGYTLSQALDKIDEPSITQSSLRDAAEEIFDECWLHEVPESIRFYIDYDKFARDCEMGGDLIEFEYNNQTYTCTNAAGI